MTSDEEAEHFVATADLSEYDLSEFVVAPLRFADRLESVSLVWSPDLVRRVEAEAERKGTSREDFIRSAVERALRDLAA